MSYTGHLIESYLARTGLPREGQRDAHYSYQWAVLRDMLARLEVILDDEGVPRETAVRVMRCLLYGAPSAAEAGQRMKEQEELVKLLTEQPGPHVNEIRGLVGLGPIARMFVPNGDK